MIYNQAKNSDGEIVISSASCIIIHYIILSFYHYNIILIKYIIDDLNNTHNQEKGK